jgi:hypothetical protein
MGYMEKYDAEMMTEDAKKVRAEKNIGKNSGRIQTEEEKIIRSESNKRVWADNPELVENARIRAKKRTEEGTNPLQSETVKEKNRQRITIRNKTEEARIKSRENAYKYFFTEEAISKSAQNRIGLKQSEETKKKRSNTVLQQFQNGRKAPHSKIIGTYTSKKTGQKCSYRSLFELKYFQILDNDPSILFWIYEPISISYDFEEGVHIYYPDILANNRELIEIKSKYYWFMDREKCEAKAKAARQYCKEHHLIYKILYEEDLGMSLNCAELVKNYNFPRE